MYPFQLYWYKDKERTGENKHCAAQSACILSFCFCVSQYTLQQSPCSFFKRYLKVVWVQLKSFHYWKKEGQVTSLQPPFSVRFVFMVLRIKVYKNILQVRAGYNTCRKSIILGFCTVNAPFDRYFSTVTSLLVPADYFSRLSDFLSLAK